MGWDAPWHWIVLAVIVIALFGYKRMPDAARSLGRSLRIFKTEIKGMSEDDKKRDASQATTKPAAVEAAPQPAVPPAEPLAQPAAPTVVPAENSTPVTTPASNGGKPADSAE